MFADGIQKIARFTRPIYTIRRKYNSAEVMPATATMFFINEDGYALTTKHVVQTMIIADKLQKNYKAFKAALNGGQPDKTQEELEEEFHIKAGQIVQVANNFVNCVDTFKELTFTVHPHYDLAMIKFTGFNQLHCNQFAQFISDDTSIRQGDFLCRAGFAFPEFKNYRYNPETDNLEWTGPAKQASLFPVEGMLTRFLMSPEPRNEIYGIEMSTPGLMGHSGAPLFTSSGAVCGMQFAAVKFHTGFDTINQEIIVRDEKRIVSDYPFMQLGQCIHSSIIKKFLREHNVKFYEEKGKAPAFFFNNSKATATPLS